MNRHQHHSNNDILGAPSGVPIEECVALPVTRVKFPDGLDAVVSFWMPSASDLQLINSGRAVRLLIFGRTHAPVSIGVDGDGDLAPIS